MALDPGSSRSSAVDLGTLSTSRLKQTIGGKDKLDFYKFSLGGSSSFNFSAKLKGLKANADLALLSSSGAVVQQSKLPGTAKESLNLSLTPATYYVRVRGSSATTPYRLNLFATGTGLPTPGPTPGPGPVPTPGPTPTPNTAPTLSGSLALSALRGSLTPSSTVLTSISLNATDTQQNASQLTYTLTTLPKSGGLYRSGTALGAGSTFTQADLNSGLVSYQQQAITNLPTGSTLSSTVVFSGKNAAWTEGSGTSSEVFFYNGTTGVKAQLTTDGFQDTDVQIDGNTVVWAKRFSPTDRDIYYSVNAATAAAVNPSIGFDDTNPVVSGNQIAFKRDDTSGTDVANDGVWLYNTTTATPTQLESFFDKVGNIGISGSNVVWTKDYTTDRDIYFWNGSSRELINTSNNFDDTSPVISGGSIAFLRKDIGAPTGPNNGVYLYSVSSGSNSPTTQLDSSSTVAQLSISGSNVAWTKTYSGSDTDVRYSIGGGTATSIDGSTTLYDSIPQISGTNIVFRREDSTNSANNGLYLYGGGGSPVRLSDSSTLFANDRIGGIDGKNVGWTRYNLFTPAQASFYDGTTATDSVGFTVSDGTLTANGTLNIAIS